MPVAAVVSAAGSSAVKAAQAVTVQAAVAACTALATAPALAVATGKGRRKIRTLFSCVARVLCDLVSFPIVDYAYSSDAANLAIMIFLSIS